MKFQIKNRFNGAVQFECELSAEIESESYSVQLGVAVKAAIEARANLADANLERANLAGADLTGAYLAGADLAGADLAGAYLARADLTGADLTGAYLAGADLAGAYLMGADLTGADLTDANLTGAYLARADLTGADLTGADLTGAYLAGADLAGADLAGADLARADDPRIPRIANIHQTVYAAASRKGALNMEIWHTCETTHCRAGWVVTLAGAGGAALEFALGTGVAAALIYKASDPSMERVPNWVASNEEALADMKALADAEVARAAV